MMKLKVGDKVRFKEDFYEEGTLLFSSNLVFTITSADGYGFIKLNEFAMYWNERLFKKDDAQ